MVKVQHVITLPTIPTKGTTISIKNNSVRGLPITPQVSSTFVCPSKPKNPTVGEMFVNADTNQTSIFDGNKWVIHNSVNSVNHLKINLDVITQEGIYELHAYDLETVELIEKYPTNQGQKQNPIVRGSKETLSFLRERMDMGSYSWVEKIIFEMV